MVAKQNAGTRSRRSSAYPVQLDIDYPHRLNRWSTLFRIILIIPIFILLLSVSGYMFVSHFLNATLVTSGGFLILGPLLIILFRKKYPAWWFNWNLELLRFMTRVNSYFYLLTDKYPATDDQQTVHLNATQPQPRDLMRGMPIIKWILAIPHYICLIVLGIVSIIVLIIAWIAIIFTAHYPRPLFNYVVGYFRWWTRVICYAFLLFTDKYPPFSLS